MFGTPVFKVMGPFLNALTDGASDTVAERHISIIMLLSFFKHIFRQSFFFSPFWDMTLLQWAMDSDVSR